MQSSPPGSYGNFHLKDGRRLVFYPVRKSSLRRRTGEVLAVAFVLVAAALAATLLAATRMPCHPPHGETRSVAVS